jgi:hypothetical protein
MGQAISARSAPVELVARSAPTTGWDPTSTCSPGSTAPERPLSRWRAGSSRRGSIRTAARTRGPRRRPRRPAPPVRGAVLRSAAAGLGARRRGCPPGGGLRLVIRSDAVAVRMLPGSCCTTGCWCRATSRWSTGGRCCARSGKARRHPRRRRTRRPPSCTCPCWSRATWVPTPRRIWRSCWRRGRTGTSTWTAGPPCARSPAAPRTSCTWWPPVVPGANGWHSLALAADPGEPAGRAVTGAELLAAARSAVLAPSCWCWPRPTPTAGGRRGPRRPHRGRVPRPRLRRGVHRLRPGLLPRAGGGSAVEEAAAVGRTSTLREPDAAPAEWALPWCTAPRHTG